MSGLTEFALFLEADCIPALLDDGCSLQKKLDRLPGRELEMLQFISQKTKSIRISVASWSLKLISLVVNVEILKLIDLLILCLSDICVC